MTGRSPITVGFREIDSEVPPTEPAVRSFHPRPCSQRPSPCALMAVPRGAECAPRAGQRPMRPHRRQKDHLRREGRRNFIAMSACRSSRSTSWPHFAAKTLTAANAHARSFVHLRCENRPCPWAPARPSRSLRAAPRRRPWIEVPVFKVWFRRGPNLAWCGAAWATPSQPSPAPIGPGIQRCAGNARGVPAAIGGGGVVIPP